MRRIAWKTSIVTALVLLTAGAVSYGEVIRVDNDGVADFATIQQGIDAAAEGDTVLVAPGIYRGDGNRDIDFAGKAITVRSKDGAQTCIIDCQGSEAEPHRGFYFHSGEDANSILEGVSIINGYADWGGGILCDEASPTITGCIVSRNTATVSGGGVSLLRSCSRIYGCVLSENHAMVYGGGFIVAGNGVFIIRNCTIINNRAGNLGGGIGFGGGRGEAFVHDTILWGNRAPAGMQLTTGPPTVGGSVKPTLKYCCIEPGENSASRYEDGPPIEGIFESNHNISDDPLLVITNTGDCHLKSQAGRWDPNSTSWVQDGVTSPCIDAGDPNSPIGYEPFPNGGVINIGAYGGTAEASKSYFGEPPCEAIIAGDINGDCRVDFADLAILTQHWLAHLPPQVPIDGDGDEDPGRPGGR